MNLLIQNRHWNKDFSYGLKIKRDQYSTLLKYIKDKQIIALTGLRRVGKTTLLKQIIDHLIIEKVNRTNLFIFSFDEKRLDLDELLKEYETQANVSISKDKLYIFLDEIQKLENWQEKIKIYYDNYPNIKFFISGSQSLFIRKKSQESLAGRIYIINVPLLTFKEHLIFKGKENFLNNKEMFKEEIKKEIIPYLKRGYIELIDADEERTQFFLESLMNKVIYEDIPMLFPVEDPEKLKLLFQMIYSNPGMIINYESIAGDFKMSAKTVEKYISYLIEAKLVKKVYNYSNNFLTSEKKLKKIYTTATCFCFLNKEFDLGKVVENQVSLTFNFFWRDSFKNEVDFIIKEDKKPIPLEVKFSNNLKSEWTKPMKLFMGKNKIEKGIIITEDIEKIIIVDKKEIMLIPIHKWLLK